VFCNKRRSDPRFVGEKQKKSVRGRRGFLLNPLSVHFTEIPARKPWQDYMLERNSRA
jgi:hypothetical protein